jgi:hypothetical protein
MVVFSSEMEDFKTALAQAFGFIETVK